MTSFPLALLSRETRFALLFTLACGCVGHEKEVRGAVGMGSPASKILSEKQNPAKVSPENFVESTSAATHSSAISTTVAGRTFDLGIHYVVPQGFRSFSWLPEFETNALLKHNLLTDMKVMAALGVKNVTFAIDPGGNGMQWGTDTNAGKPCYGMSINEPELAATISNLKTIAKTLKNNGLKAHFRFMSNHLFFGSSFGWNCAGNTNRWWQNWGAPGCTYWGATEAARADAMGKQWAEWENRIVSGVESDSEASSNISYWTLLAEHQYAGKEQCPGSSDVGWHMAYRVLHDVVVPSGKLGADTGTNPAWSQNLASTAKTLGKTINITGFSAYPNQNNNGGSNQDVFAALATTRSGVPSAPAVVVQEAGSHYCESRDEQKQIHTEFNGGLKDIFDQAFRFWKATPDLPMSGAYLWSLWDYFDRGDCNAGAMDGLGANINSPRDVYGYMASLAWPFNGDFESDFNGWNAGGFDSHFTMERKCHGYEDSATGRCYLRLDTTSAAGHWMCTPTQNVSQQNRFVVGGYLRNGITSGDFVIDLHYRTANGWAVQSQKKNWNQAGWVWKHIQSLPDNAGGAPSPWEFRLNVFPDQIFVCFGATGGVAGSRYSMDLDAITVGSGSATP
jgi:hypothetical protein